MRPDSLVRFRLYINCYLLTYLLTSITCFNRYQFFLKATWFYDGSVYWFACADFSVQDNK